MSTRTMYNDVTAYNNSLNRVDVENQYVEFDHYYADIDDTIGQWVDLDDENNYGGYRHTVKPRKDFM